MEYGLLGLVVLVLDIIAIVNIIQSGLDPVMKLVWVLLVLVLPVVGMALWFIIGSKKVV
ncbi:MAG: PLDc N-terminal domain-containing protein [Alphaproteobacteria bacterium]|nr:PLDc N-terminal domain-containing protein [Alphaproteobacteria bacterium]